MQEKLDFLILRGVHPQEVSAFYLAKEVSKALEQRGHTATLVKIPYDYSLAYLVDHHSSVISKHYELFKCPRELEKIKEKEYEEELRRATRSVERRDAWDSTLVCLYPYMLIDKIRERHKGKTAIEFHNFVAGDHFDRNDKALATIFSLKNYEGFVLSESDKNYYTIEIPAIFRRVPQEILKKRKNVLKLIKKNENTPEHTLVYLEEVVDFAKSKAQGLTDSEAVRTIAEVIEDVVRKKK